MPADDRQVRRFADFLLELNDGDSHEELSNALNALVEAVTITGKGGQITYVLKVAPAGRGGKTVMVTDKITVEDPEPERTDSIWFVDADNNVVRNNPAQQRLPLRELPDPVRYDPDYEGETGEVDQ